MQSHLSHTRPKRLTGNFCHTSCGLGWDVGCIDVTAITRNRNDCHIDTWPAAPISGGRTDEEALQGQNLAEAHFVEATRG